MKDYNEFWRIMKGAHGEHPSVRFRNYLIIKAVRQIFGYAKINTMLDVGCGNGDLLRQINNYLLSVNGANFSLSGFDISEYQISKNKLQRLPFDFKILDFNERIEINDKFRIIICSEVIEHLKNWKTALENIAKMNEPSGYLIITTQSGKRLRSDYDLGHLQHFELKRLEDHLKILNYEIIESEKYGFPFYNLQKIVHSIFFPVSAKIAHNNTNRTASVLFSITYFLFRVSLKSKNLGPQIFILARKIC